MYIKNVFTWCIKYNNKLIGIVYFVSSSRNVYMCYCVGWLDKRKIFICNTYSILVSTYEIPCIVIGMSAYSTPF